MSASAGVDVKLMRTVIKIHKYVDHQIVGIDRIWAWSPCTVPLLPLWGTLLSEFQKYYTLNVHQIFPFLPLGMLNENVQKDQTEKFIKDKRLCYR